MADNNQEFNISLGVKLNESNLKSVNDKMKNLTSKDNDNNKIKLTIDDSQIDKRFEGIKQKLAKLGKIKVEVKDVSSKEKKNQIQKQTDEIKKAFNDLLEVQKRINNARINITNLDTSKDAKQILGLSDLIDTLSKKYKALYDNFGKDFTTEQFDKLNYEIDKTVDKIDLIKDRAEDARKNLFSSISKKNISGTFDKELSNIESKFLSLTNITDDVFDNIDKLKNTFLNLQNYIKAGNLDEAISENEKYNEILKQVTNSLTVLSNEEKEIKKERKTENIIKNTEKLKERFLALVKSGKFEIEISDVEKDFNSLSVKALSVINQFKKLKESFEEIQKVSMSDDYNKMLSANEKYEDSLRRIKNTLKVLTDQQKASFESQKLLNSKSILSDKMEYWFLKNYDTAKIFENEVIKLQKELQKCDETDFGKIKGEFEKLKIKVSSLNLPIEKQSDDTIKAYNDIVKLQKRIGDARVNLTGLDVEKDKEQISQLNNLIDSLSKKYELLYETFSKDFTLKQMESLDYSIDKTADKIELIKRKLEDTSKSNIINKAYEDITKLQKRIGDAEISISGLDSNKNAEQILLLKDLISDLKKEYRELYDIFGTKFSTEQIENLNASILQVEDRVDIIKSKALDAQKNIFNEIKSKDISGTFNKEISDVESGFLSLTNVTDDVFDSIDKLKSSLSNIRNYIKIEDFESVISENREYNRTLEQVTNSIRILSNQEKELNKERKNIKSKEDFIKLVDSGKFDAEVSNIKKGYDEISNKSLSLINMFRDLNSALENVRISATTNDFDKMFSANEKFRDSVSKITNAIKILSNEQEKSRKEQESLTEKSILSNKLETWYKENYESAKNFEEEVIRIRKELEKYNGTDLSKIKGSFEKLKSEVKLYDASKQKGQTDDVIKAYNDIIKIQKRISEARIKVVDLDTEKDAKQILTLSNLIDDLSKKYELLYETFSKDFTTSQMEELDFIIDKTANKIELLTKKSEDARRNIANTINQKIVSSQFSTEITDVETKFNNLSVKTGTLSNEIIELKKVFAEINLASKANDIEGIISASDKYDKLLIKINNEIKRFSKEQEEVVKQQKLISDRTILSDKMDIWLKQNSAAAKQFGDKIRELQEELKNCDAIRLTEINKEFDKIIKQAILAGKNTKTFGDRLKESFTRLSSYFSITTVFYQASRALRSMYDNIIKVDSAMTNLYKVTDETADRYNRFLSDASKNAKELGRDISSFVEQTANWAKLGYSLEDAESLSKLSSIYANVAEVSDETAVADMVSAMKAFNIETKNAVTIVDAFNELGNKFAVSAAGIGEGLKKSASALAVAGTDMYHAMAMIAGGAEITQDAGEFGSFLKVASMRVRGMKGELEELGEEVDENVESISKMQTRILNLTKGKVNIFDAKGDFKDYYEIIKDISKVVDHISSTEKADLYETLFGKLRANQGAALIQAFQSGQVQKAYDTAIKSAGSAYKEQEKWMNSIEAKINQLNAAWQGLSQTFLNSDLIKSLVSGTEGFVTLLDTVIDKSGSLSIVLGTLFAGLSAFKKKGFLLFDENTLSSFKNAEKMITSHNKAIELGGGILDIWNKHIEKTDGTTAKYIKTLGVQKASMLGLTKSIVVATAKTALLKAGTIALNAAMGIGIGLVIHLIGLGISKVVDGIKESLKSTDEKLKDLNEDLSGTMSDIKKISTDFKNLKSETNNIISVFEELGSGVNKFGENVSLTESDYNEFIENSNKLAKIFPQLVIGYDENGNAVLNLSNGIERLVEDIKELVQEMSDDSKFEISEKLPEVIENTNEKIKLYKQEANDIKILQKSVFDAKYIDVYRQEVLKLENELKKYGIEYKKINYYTNPYGSGEVTDNRYGGTLLRTEFSYSDKEKRRISSIIEKIQKDINDKIEYTSKQTNPIISAWLDTDLDFQEFSPKLQTIIKSIISNMDIDFSELDTAEKLQDFILTEIVNPIKDDDSVQNALLKLFSIDESEVSLREYGSEIYKIIGSLSEKLGKPFEDLLKYSGFDSILNRYSSMAKEIADATGQELFKVDEMSISNIEEAFDLVKNYGITSWEDLSIYMKNNTFSNIIDIEKEKEGFDLIISSINESSTALGLSSESVAKLRDRYSEMKSENINELFERTENGININTDALMKLENEYKKSQQLKYEKQLEDQIDAYNDLANSIKVVKDEEIKKQKIEQLNNIGQQIQETNDLIYQYKGLVSAYNSWIEAQKTENEGSMYEQLVSDLEKIKELYEKGLVGTDDFRAAVQLMSSVDLSTADIETLINTYEDGMSKMERYFTENQDGVKNLLNDIMAVNEEWVKLNENGEYEIKIPDFQSVAEELGLNVETVEAAFKRLKDYGFDIDITSANDSLQNLQTKASETEDAVKNVGADIKPIISFRPNLDAIDEINFDRNAKVYYTPVFPSGSETAHYRPGHYLGRAEVNGTAFSKGNWGTKDSGIALGGELGEELVVRNGNFFTIGKDSAEMFNYEKDDIIFNAEQTREIFEKGKITGNNKRGKAFAPGTGATGGGSFSNDIYDYNKNSSSNRVSSSSSSAKEFKETLDWIEIAISRIERAISNLNKKASNVYEIWSKRNKSLKQQILKTREEIELQEKAYARYQKEADSVGLEENYAKLVRSGKIDIETIKDEDLADRIKEYQNWYEKAIQCKDAIDELNESVSSLYATAFENVVSEYENMLSSIENEKNLIDEYINRVETQGKLVSKEYYQTLISKEEANLQQLEKERNALIKSLDDAVSSGSIKEYSEQWYDMKNSIDDVTLSIEESKTSIIEYANSIRDIEWKTFDILANRIGKITDEADFLIDLFNDEKLYDKQGRFTDEGKSVVGLRVSNYSAYIQKANEYAKEIQKLDKEIANDPYNQELIERRQELLELQRENISSSENEKQAIIDMVREGIQIELDALRELIDTYSEALDSEKDLYEYQKKIEEQTKNIANLEKQLSAYQGDESEETRQKIQEIKVSLEKAKTSLEETQYDRYISDTKKLLDDLYSEYETILNERLDNTDALFEEIINDVNNNGSIIAETIESKADSVGYQISDDMSKIWELNTGNIIDSVGNYVNDININLQQMIMYLSNIANEKLQYSENNGSSSKPGSNSKPKEPPKKETPKDSNTKTDKDYYGVALAIWNGGYGWGFGSNRDKNLKAKGFDINKMQNVINKIGNDGYINSGNWSGKYYGITDLSKYHYNKYASGSKKIKENEFAWTQENGSEIIVRPSDGAILTPLAKNDSVLNSNATNNIWDMANNPRDFILNNLGFDVGNIDKKDNGVKYNQNFENLTFNFPNVKNYEDIIKSMKDDKNFERLINAMTIDRLNGKSSLLKGKSIR